MTTIIKIILNCGIPHKIGSEGGGGVCWRSVNIAADGCTHGGGQLFTWRWVVVDIVVES